METHIIQPHNLKAAAAWDSGGANYDKISQTIADAIEHCVLRLAPQTGEQILDVATGTGWTARRIAAYGAHVTGIDLGSDLIEAARALANAAQLDIEFRTGDAEALPFENRNFDAVISTFGVMFSGNPQAAANELSRVCKSGGRIALTTWKPDSTISDFFNMVKPYMAPPVSPAPPSPFEWGRKERLQELLGSSFDLRFESGNSVLYSQSGQAVWDLFSTGFGPIKMLATTLDPERVEKLKQDFIAFHERFRTDIGIAMPREYLVTVGIRK